MEECEILKTCPFFNDKMANMPALSNVFKNKYCKNHYKKCARYMVCKAIGREKVPADLFPNQEERVQHIISSENEKWK